MQRFNFITFNIHSDADLFVDMAKYVSKKIGQLLLFKKSLKKKLLNK